MLPTTFEYKDDGLETVNRGKHDNCDKWELTGSGCDEVDEITEINNCCREDKGSEEIDKNNETHTKATKTTHIIQQYQLHKIVHRTTIRPFIESCTY